MLYVIMIHGNYTLYEFVDYRREYWEEYCEHTNRDWLEETGYLKIVYMERYDIILYVSC